MKFILKCPECKKEFEYRMFSRDSARVTCKHCGAKLTVSIRFTLLVLELLQFYVFINFIEPNFMADWPIVLILLSMLVFCGTCTMIIFAMINHFIDSGFIFEVNTEKKVSKK